MDQKKERKPRTWTKSFTKRVMRLADVNTSVLGYSLLPETNTLVRCGHGGCHYKADEQWLLPDPTNAAWDAAKRADRPAPTRVIARCKKHSWKRIAVRDDRNHAKEGQRHREYVQRTANIRRAESLSAQLMKLAVALPPGISDVWPDIVSAAYAVGSRHGSYGAYELGRLKNALITYFASLSDTERTLLALTTPLPTKEN